MIKSFYKILTLPLLISVILLTPLTAKAQRADNFWKNVHYGGSVGLSFGTGYTDVSLAPGALYRFNRYVAAGAGIQGTYVDYKNYYRSFIYGGSVIGIFSPVPQIQLSAELEQLRVNLTYADNYDFNGYYDNTGNARERNFWNTALFLGAGYTTGNVTVGLRFNVLYNESNLVYSTAYMPFVRVYF